MKNKTMSTMTTSKKKSTLGGIALALGVVSILSIGTLTAFAAERTQPVPNSPTQNSTWRMPDEWLVSDELLERLQKSGVDTIIYDPSQSPSLDTFGERVNIGGMDIFRVTSEASPNVFNLDELVKSSGMEIPGEVIVFDGIESPPSTFRIGDSNLELVPIVGASGETHMISRLFFDMIFAMNYEEFNAFTELLSTTTIFSMQEPVDVNILRELWLAAQ